MVMGFLSILDIFDVFFVAMGAHSPLLYVRTLHGLGMRVFSNKQQVVL